MNSILVFEWAIDGSPVRQGRSTNVYVTMATRVQWKNRWLLPSYVNVLLVGVLCHCRPCLKTRIGAGRIRKLLLNTSQAGLFLVLKLKT